MSNTEALTVNVVPGSRNPTAPDPYDPVLPFSVVKFNVRSSLVAMADPITAVFCPR